MDTISRTEENLLSNSNLVCIKQYKGGSSTFDGLSIVGYGIAIALFYVMTRIQLTYPDIYQKIPQKNVENGT